MCNKFRHALWWLVEGMLGNEGNHYSFFKQQTLLQINSKTWQYEDILLFLTCIYIIIDRDDRELVPAAAIQY